jgi:hypothetical protein
VKAAHIAFFVSAVQHRAAFVALIALVVGAGIPLAYAWARVLPEDAPPFKIEPGSFPSVDLEPAPAEPPKNSRRDLISLALLLCITLTYLARFPGMPLAALIHGLQSALSTATANGIVSAVHIFLLTGTGLAACVAAVRPGRMRVPLICAASLALILWLLGPILQSAMVAG